MGVGVGVGGRTTEAAGQGHISRLYYPLPLRESNRVWAPELSSSSVGTEGGGGSASKFGFGSPRLNFNTLFWLPRKTRITPSIFFLSIWTGLTLGM